MYSFIILALVRKTPKRSLSESQKKYFPISIGVRDANSSILIIAPSVFLIVSLIKGELSWKIRARRGRRQISVL